MMETYRETLDALNRGEVRGVLCPDGVTREVWGYDPNGAVFVSGWKGDVWMDCSDGTLRLEFEGH